MRYACVRRVVFLWTYQYQYRYVNVTCAIVWWKKQSVQSRCVFTMPNLISENLAHGNASSHQASPRFKYTFCAMSTATKTPVKSNSTYGFQLCRTQQQYKKNRTKNHAGTHRTRQNQGWVGVELCTVVNPSRNLKNN